MQTLIVGLVVGLATPSFVGSAQATVGRHKPVPAVHIASPAKKTTVHGTVVIDGTVASRGGVRKVRVRVSGLPHAGRATGRKHWSYVLDTTLLADGPHTITVRAVSRAGSRSATTTQISVDNASSPPPTITPITLGIWSDGVSGHTTDLLESQIGRMFGAMRYNYKFMATIPSSAGDASFDAGRPVFYNNAESQNIGGAPIRWADIAAGKYDSHLAEVVQAFRSDPRWTHANPYLFSFHHEQDVAAGFGKYGTPADYQAAYRHVFTYFQNAGILWRDGGQVEMVWDITRNSLNSGSAQKYDPDLSATGKNVVGDYYDILGLDVYNKVQSNGHLSYTDPHRAFDPAHQYALARGKQFGIFELGVTEGAPGEKAAFFSQIVPTLESYGQGVPGSAMALMYSNVTGKQVYYADTSASSMAAFIAMANDPLFAAP